MSCRCAGGELPTLQTPPLPVGRHSRTGQDEALKPLATMTRTMLLFFIWFFLAALGSYLAFAWSLNLLPEVSWLQ